MRRRFWQKDESKISERALPPVVEPGKDERRYLQGVTYVLPKDMPEGARLDFQHYLLHAILGANYAAPVSEQGGSMLDVATGTGRWAHEMARAFPHTQVIGLDMEVPREIYEPPANYRFVQGNLFAGLPFASGSFDFVHQRFLVLALPAKQWPFILSELTRVTRSGGYIELVEGGGNFLCIGPATTQLKQWWDVASKAYGIDVSLMARLPQLLQEAGLHHIQHQTFRVPVGVWGGRVGAMLEQDILASLPGIKSFICKNASIPPDTFDRVARVLPGEWRTYQTCYEYYLVYGKNVRRSSDE